MSVPNEQQFPNPNIMPGSTSTINPDCENRVDPRYLECLSELYNDFGHVLRKYNKATGNVIKELTRYEAKVNLVIKASYKNSNPHANSEPMCESLFNKGICDPYITESSPCLSCLLCKLDDTVKDFCRVVDKINKDLDKFATGITRLTEAAEIMK